MLGVDDRTFSILKILLILSATPFRPVTFALSPCRVIPGESKNPAVNEPGSELGWNTHTAT